jgi:hypothetical protein
MLLQNKSTSSSKFLTPDYQPSTLSWLSDLSHPMAVIHTKLNLLKMRINQALLLYKLCVLSSQWLIWDPGLNYILGLLYLLPKKKRKKAARESRKRRKRRGRVFWLAVMRVEAAEVKAGL